MAAPTLGKLQDGGGGTGQQRSSWARHGDRDSTPVISQAARSLLAEIQATCSTTNPNASNPTGLDTPGLATTGAQAYPHFPPTHAVLVCSRSGGQPQPQITVQVPQPPPVPAGNSSIPVIGQGGAGGLVGEK